MVSIHDVRHAHLLALERQFGSLKSIERASGGALSANYLSQLKNRSREMGDRYAREIEAALGLATGALDLASGGEHASRLDRVMDRPDVGARGGIRHVPLLSWAQIERNGASPWEPVEWLPLCGPAGPRAFALRVVGDAMSAPDADPSFPPGTLIVIDPDVLLSPGCYVVARLRGEPAATFKQLVRDGGRRLLKPLNPRYPLIELAQGTELVGVVVALAERWLLPDDAPTGR